MWCVGRQGVEPLNKAARIEARSLHPVEPTHALERRLRTVNDSLHARAQLRGSQRHKPRALGTARALCRRVMLADVLVFILVRAAAVGSDRHGGPPWRTDVKSVLCTQNYKSSSAWDLFLFFLWRRSHDGSPAADDLKGWRHLCARESNTCNRESLFRSNIVRHALDRDDIIELLHPTIVVVDGMP